MTELEGRAQCCTGSSNVTGCTWVRFGDSSQTGWWNKKATSLVSDEWQVWQTLLGMRFSEQ
jgi:hypothetical protein